MNRAKSATGGGDARQNGVKHVTSTVKAEHNHGEAIAFGGSIGGAVLTIVLPVTVFFLTLAMDKVLENISLCECCAQATVKL